MSSSVFSAEFAADRALRRCVWLSGVIFSTTGLIVILLLPIHVAVTVAASLIWVLYSLREQIRLRRAHRRFSRWRISHDGELRVLDSDGDWQGGQLLAGSVLLRHAGWIRLRTEDGSEYAELIRGGCRYSADWRRLQVIWRHVGAAPVSC